MCRLLFIDSKNKFDTKHKLEIFADLCKNSKEFQGHGWGLAYLENNEWKHYKNINPIWEDDFSQFPKTNRLIAHARSAFRDKDIRVENNMPFYDDKYIFIFNGELHGVKIKSEGRIGAEKIFNFIKRFNSGDMEIALKKGVGIIEKRSSYIRAMNIIIADKHNVFVSTKYSEDPEYFTLRYKKTNDQLIICSDKFPNDDGWNKFDNNFTGEIK